MKCNAWDVCITTYDMCISEQNILKQVKWQYMIVDEGHKIKNEKIMLSKVLRAFQPARRILLTGTPFQNNLHELWALLNFIHPEKFPDSIEFDLKFTPQECLRNINLVQQLQEILKPLLLRRLKCDVAKDLKPKIEKDIFAELLGLQKTRYKEILQKNLLVYDLKTKLVKHEINNLMIELRKCSNHPYLMENEIIYTNVADLLNNCGKMQILDELLAKLQRQGSRVLIFSQMRRMLDILEQYCLWRDYAYYRLDGKTECKDRTEMVAEFNLEDSKKFIFMLTTRAGGLGINLQSADVVIIYDSDWNPQSDLQAIDRAHRIGQTNEVLVYRLTTKETVEEYVLKRAKTKLRLDELVIQQGKYTGKDKTKEMAQVIRCNAEGLLKTFTPNPKVRPHQFDDDRRKYNKRRASKTKKK
jgi:SWI/SNF-related matrix-associated actin-dependent regulator of chromatin subfamily A member 5